MIKKATEALLIGALIVFPGVAGRPLQVTSGMARAVSGDDPTTAQAPPLSPRLLALQKELEANSKAALESFWQEVTKKGTPLVEPTPDKGNYLYVTFLWRGKEGTENVIVDTLDQNNQLPDPGFFPQARMTLLAGSDVWYRTYRLRNDARFSYRVSPNDALTLLPDLKPEEQAKRLATLQPDPLNPRHYRSRNGDSSVVELPKAPPQPWIQPLPGVAAGRVEKTNFKSAILNNERQVWVYTPPGYKRNGQPYPLVVTFDGETYLAKAEDDGMAMPTTLDNLLASEKGDRRDQVWIMNADGSPQTLLTGGIGHNIYPSFSADGRRILFSSSNRDGGDASYVEGSYLYVMNADGTNLKPLSHIQSFFARFSPDGRRLAFIAGKFPESKIYLADADGGNQKVLGASPFLPGAKAR